MSTLAPIMIILLLISVWRASRNGMSDLREFGKEATLPLRGVLALLVVIGHLDSDLRNGATILRWVHWATPAVGVFFFLSGFGFQKSFQVKAGYLDGFVCRTWIRLLIPPVLLAVVYIVIHIVLDGTLPTFWGPFLADGTVTILPNSWYVIEILLLVVLFAFVNALFSGRMAVFVLFVACACISVVLRWMLCWRVEWWWSTMSFAIGMAFAAREGDIRRVLLRFPLRCYQALLLVYFAVCCLAYLMPSYTSIASELPYWLLGPIVMLLAYGGISFQGKPLAALGKVAYEIYLIHGIFMVVLSEMHLCSGAYVILVVGLTVVAAFPLHQLNGQIIQVLRK